VENIFNADVSFLHILFRDITKDQYLLSDWKFPGAPGFFPDFFFFGIISLFVDKVQLINFLFSFLQFIAIIGLMFLVLKKILCKQYTVFYPLLLLLFSLFLLATLYHNRISSFTFYLLHPTYHTNVQINTLMGLLLVLHYIAKPAKKSLILLGIVVILGVVSDKIFVLSFIIPLFATYFIINGFGLKNISLIITVLFSCLIGLVISHVLVPQFIYQSKPNYDINIISANVFIDLFTFFRFYFNSVLIHKIIFLLSLLSMGVTLVVLIIKGKQPDLRIYFHWFYFFLFWCVLLAPFVTGVFKHSVSIRYCIFIFYFSMINLVILLSRLEKVPAFTHNIVNTSLLCLIMLLMIEKMSFKNVLQDLSTYLHYKPQYIECLDNIATEIELEFGVGNYWVTHPILLFSDKDVRTYPVYSSSFLPHVPVSNRNWYYNMDHGKYNSPVFNFIIQEKNLKEDKIMRKFPEMDTIVDCGDYTIYKTNSFKFSKEDNDIYFLDSENIKTKNVKE
jgi:hypothetical protein